MNCYLVHRWCFLYFLQCTSLGKHRVWAWAWTMRKKRKNIFFFPYPHPPSINGQEILIAFIFLCTFNGLLRGNRGSMNRLTCAGVQDLWNHTSVLYFCVLCKGHCKKSLRSYWYERWSILLLINSQCLHVCAQTVFHLSHWLNAVDMNMKFNDKPHYLMILFNVNKKLDNHDIKG